MRIALLLPLILLALAGPVSAVPSGFGLQLGASFDQSDLMGGIHYLLPITHRIILAPSIDLSPAGGVGGITFNGNAHVNLIPDAEVGPYVGAGISSYSAGASTDTADVPDAAGPTLIGGVWFNRNGGTAFSLEGRFGFSGLPAFTALVGVTF